MKRELATIKKDIGVIKDEIVKLQETDRRIAASVSRLEGRMDGVERRLAETATKDDVSRIIGHIVAFTRDVEGARRDRLLSSDAYMRHQYRLDDHENRLSRLESKRS